MAAVRSLCQRAVTLRHGQITDDGTTVDVVGRYLSEFTTIANVQLSQRHDRSGDGSVRVTSLKIQSDLDTEFIASDSPLRICVTYDANAPIRNPRILVGIYDENDTGIYGLDSQVAGTIPSTLSASGTLCCVTEPIAITSGRCFVNVAFFNNETLADHVVNASYFDIESSDFFGNGRSIERSWMNTLLRHRWNCDEGHRDG
jgi:lipopolysaccharide transport system ATP-binding protein